jgi:hypothetical protein
LLGTSKIVHGDAERIVHHVVDSPNGQKYISTPQSPVTDIRAN